MHIHLIVSTVNCVPINQKHNRMSTVIIQWRTVRKYNIQVHNMASYEVGAPRCIGARVMFIHAFSVVFSLSTPPHRPLFVPILFSRLSVWSPASLHRMFCITMACIYCSLFLIFPQAFTLYCVKV